MATAMAVMIKALACVEGPTSTKIFFLIEKHSFSSILVILEPSRPHKWIRLEISLRMISGGLEVKNAAIS